MFKNPKTFSADVGANNILKKDNTILVFVSLVAITVICVIAAILVCHYKIKNRDTILENVYIKGIDVSNLSKDDALKKVEDEINSKMNNHVVLKYSNYQFYVEPEQFEAKFDVESAVEYAYHLAKTDNIIENFQKYFEIKYNGINIEPKFEYNEDELKFFIQGLQDELPDQLEQSSYYIEDKNLIITAGKNGAVIYTDKIANAVIKDIENLNFENSIYELPTYTVYPDAIDLNSIHDEVYKEMQNAYYTTDPYMIYVEQEGVDFSVDELAKKITENPYDDEYRMALQITKPEVTIDDIGIDAFPNKLSSYSTKYTNNANRTTNLRIAAGKINSKVVMPGETFSFNKVVGQRTAAAGYKNAAIFVNGGVEDGLAGGICQISTTLYNAVNLADLEVTERRNHSQLATYAQPGRDATVVWGSSDLKFINTRTYPIKILFDVSNGYATCSIYGLKQEDECEISLETETIKKTSTTMVVDAYKVYKQNGVVIKREKLHRDTYKI